MPNRPDVPCAVCGKLLWSSLTSLPEGQRTCRECRAARRKPKAEQRETTCAICGTVYLATRVDARFCSPECHARRKRDGLRPQQPCRTCGAMFSPSATTSAYCNPLCRPWIQRPVKIRWTQCPSKEHWFTAQGGQRCDCCKRPRLTADYRTERPCVECGERLVLDRWNLRRLRCDSCLADQRRRYKSKRRALKRNAYVADVYRADIFKRDRFTCQLCHKRLDMDAVVPHPLAPTIDHIIPLAAGGTHEPSNVHAAHFLCNARKSAGGSGEQLRLIG